jgi:hypothetical protein
VCIAFCHWREDSANDYSLVYNLTLAPERANPWYRDGHPTISCDRFHLCPTEGSWAGGERRLHTDKALAFLILYGSMPSRLLIPIMKIKDPFARFSFDLISMLLGRYLDGSSLKLFPILVLRIRGVLSLPRQWTSHIQLLCRIAEPSPRVKYPLG